MIINLLSYTDSEIEAVLSATTETCSRLDIQINSERGRAVLRRAVDLVASGVGTKAELTQRLHIQ